jgi:hypothetical protein
MTTTKTRRQTRVELEARCAAAEERVRALEAQVSALQQAIGALTKHDATPPVVPMPYPVPSIPLAPFIPLTPVMPMYRGHDWMTRYTITCGGSLPEAALIHPAR